MTPARPEPHSPRSLAVRPVSAPKPQAAETNSTAKPNGTPLGNKTVPAHRATQPNGTAQSNRPAQPNGTANANGTENIPGPAPTNVAALANAVAHATSIARTNRVALKNGTAATNGAERPTSSGGLGTPVKLILRNRQSPGDLVMLTAAVRDLHRAHPSRFITDVRTSCPAIWEHNPLVTSIADNDPDARTLDCRYPLIHRSNKAPFHFVHGFAQHLEEALQVRIPVTEFRGDLHLSEQEKNWISQVMELTGEDTPFWIINAGGKFDYTTKWWDPARFQQVVDHYRGRLAFVQVGERGHHHPGLDGVLDLRGKTSLRQLIRLVYHAEGIVCGVTALMHLAAAVPMRPERLKNRACVVIAGGREPMQWEAYPHHQYLHTNGAMPCCDQGGCWKARVTPLGDGDAKDKSLCLQPIALARRPGTGGANNSGEVAPLTLPKCMDLITAADVIRGIERYLEGGSVRELSGASARRFAAAASANPTTFLEPPNSKKTAPGAN
jgi:ADP-heptose:LPS heptosyltransferase